MIDDPDPARPPRPSTLSAAQIDSYFRLCKEDGVRDCELAKGLTADGLAVAYFTLAGERKAAYIDRSGFAVARRSDGWRRIDVPFNPPQLTLGV